MAPTPGTLAPDSGTGGSISSDWVALPPRNNQLVDNGFYNQEKLADLLRTVNKEEINPMNVLGDEVLYFDLSCNGILSVTDHMDQIIRKFILSQKYSFEAG